MIILTSDTEKAKHTRDARDRYPTDPNSARLAVGTIPDDASAGIIIDSGAGEGAFGKASRDRYPDATILGFELFPVLKIHPSYNKFFYTDFLKTTGEDLADVVVGNPPFKHAEAFVRTGMRLLKPGGYLAFLLRIEFLCSQGRARTFWPEYVPKHVFPFAKRPGFTGRWLKIPGSTSDELYWKSDGRTDAQDYCTILWQKGFTGVTTIPRWLL